MTGVPLNVLIKKAETRCWLDGATGADESRFYMLEPESGNNCSPGSPHNRPPWRHLSRPLAKIKPVSWSWSDPAAAYNSLWWVTPFPYTARIRILTLISITTF